MARTISMDLSGATWSKDGTVAETKDVKVVLVDVDFKGPMDRLEGEFDVFEILDFDGRVFMAIGTPNRRRMVTIE